MREEGFADDGLFEKMREFFLPLTIAEQELRIENELDAQKRQTLTEHREKLVTNINKIMKEIDTQTRIFWTYDEQINSLENCLNDVRNNYAQELSTTTTGSGDGQQQQQARALQQIHRKWRQEETKLTEAIKDKKELKSDLGRTIAEFEIERDKSNARLENIKTELAIPPKCVDKRLVKPARGLIMYGPPGKVFSYKSKNNPHLLVFLK